MLMRDRRRMMMDGDSYPQLVNYMMVYDKGVENVPVEFTVGDLSSGVTRTLTKESDHLNLYISNTKVAGTSARLRWPISTSGYKVGLFNFIMSGKVYQGGFGWNDESNLGIGGWHSYGSTYQSSGYKCRNFGTDEKNFKVFNAGVNLTALNASFYCASIATPLTAKVYNLALFKPDDLTTLCSKAGITAPSDVATLVADTTKLTSIFNSLSAVKFMVKQCTGDFMANVVGNSTALNLLKSSSYYSLVYANTHWKKFIDMAA